MMREQPTEQTKKLWALLLAYKPNAHVKEINKYFAKIKKLFKENKGM